VDRGRSVEFQEAGGCALLLLLFGVLGVRRRAVVVVVVVVLLLLRGGGDGVVVGRKNMKYKIKLTTAKTIAVTLENESSSSTDDMVCII
jgi:hypothetical protein